MMKRAQTFTRALPVLIGALAIMATAPARSSAQGSWVLLNAEQTNLVRMGSEAMYNLRYAEADTIFSDLVRLNPDHPAGYFMLALVDWWRMVPNFDEDGKVARVEDSFKERIEKVIEASDKRLEKNPNDIVGLFFKGSALGYRARLTTSRGFGSSSMLTWVGALSEGKDAYDIILRCQRLAPSNSDVLLGSGLYNYLGAYIPEKYPALQNAAGFLPPGDKQIGLSMLRLSAQRATYARVEARYSLVDILSNMEENYADALPIAEQLYREYPGNAVFHKFYARALYQTANFAMADTVWHDILRRIHAKEPGYNMTLARQGLYFIGDCRLRAGDYETALRTFNEAIKISGRMEDDESGWLVMSMLRKGFVLDRMGRRREAIKAYEEVLDLPNRRDSHLTAKKYIGEPFKG